jgi:hypothetical protein
VGLVTSPMTWTRVVAVADAHQVAGDIRCGRTTPSKVSWGRLITLVTPCASRPPCRSAVASSPGGWITGQRQRNVKIAQVRACARRHQHTTVPRQAWTQGDLGVLMNFAADGQFVPRLVFC